jgi:hypothetical protein
MTTTEKRKPAAKPTKKKIVATEKVKRAEKAFRTYDQALDYLFKQTDYEKQQKLRYK